MAGYPVTMTARPITAPIACVSVIAVAGLLLTGCSTSAPASLPATATTSASPAPTDDLLSADNGTSQVGELVANFPTDLLPVPDGATILVSSAEQFEATEWEISLNVRSSKTTDELLDQIRQPLIAAGFTEQAPGHTAVGLAAQTSFTRAEGEVITVGILDGGSTRTATAGGIVLRQDAG